MHTHTHTHIHKHAHTHTHTSTSTHTYTHTHNPTLFVIMHNVILIAYALIFKSDAFIQVKYINSTNFNTCKKILLMKIFI